MSHYSRLSLTVDDLTETEAPLVEEAIADLYADLEVSNFSTQVYAEGTLRIGGLVGEEDISRKIAKAAWEVTKRPVAITANWWYDDSPPDESFYLDEEDFSEAFPALTQLAMTVEEEETDG